MLRRMVEDGIGCSVPLSEFLEVQLLCLATKPKTSKLFCPKPDVDNFAKSILDGANGILWEDDSQIIDLQVAKAWAPPKCPAQIEIRIQRLSGTSPARLVVPETT
jgi:Holliday junction resolvase RusA-like endonuclease